MNSDNTLYQGSKDVFLVGVRADFNSVEDQAKRQITSLEQNGLLSSDNQTDGLFTQVSNITTEGNSVVYRHTSTTGITSLGSRKAGGQYAAGEFIRGWETVVTDPDSQDAVEILVPEERQGAESSLYKEALNRAQKTVIATRKKNIGDPFDIFNQAFIAPTSYASVRFTAKGNQGLDGNFTALNEKLILSTHALANGATPTAGRSNLVANGANYAPFTVDYYYAGLELATTFVDDVGAPMPMFGGKVTLVLPNANGLVRTAKEINDSEWKTGTANNEVNVLEGMTNKIISSPFLTNSINYSIANTQNYKWFMVDTASQEPNTGTGLLRVSFVPTNSRVERREITDSVAYKIKQSYCYTWTDWRNVMGSLGDSSAY